MRPVTLKRTQREFPIAATPTHLHAAASSTNCGSAEARAELFGLGVDFHTYADALAWMSSILQSAEAGSKASIGFLNAHNLNVAWSDPDYRQALSQLDRVFPDGVGLRFAARMAGIPFYENLAGTDLVPSLLRHPVAQGHRVFILGERPGQIAAVKDSFLRLFPGLVLAGYHHGYFDLDQSEALVELINDSGADILLVGMGTPRQEKWLAQHACALKPRLRIGVGGLFHYWDGRLRRAPALLRRMRLEWAYILLQQPHRWRRYAMSAPMLLWYTLRDAISAASTRR